MEEYDQENLPPCFGTYVLDDKECDGEPCSLKGRCGAFTRYLGKNRKRGTSYLVIDFDKARPKHGKAAFFRFTEQLLKDEAKDKIKKEKRRKKDPNRDKRKDGPSAVAKRKSRATKARRAKEKRMELLLIFEEFVVNFGNLLKDRILATSDQIISTGQFYVSDRLMTSDYMSLRCRTTKGADLTIVIFKFKPSTLSFDIKLPFSLEQLKNLISGEVLARTTPEEKIDGRMKTIIRNAGKFKIGLVCEFLTNLINDKKIDLPEI